MKILFIAPNYLPHIGGVERHIENLSNELLKDKHKITILVQKFDNSYESYELRDDLEIIRLKKYKNRYLKRVFSELYMLKNIKKILNYDVIHFHDYSTFYAYGVLVYPLLKLFKKKIYLTFHGWEGVVPPRKAIMLKRQILARLVDGNISVGHFIQKWYKTAATIVSYGGVKEANDIVDIQEKYILFIGRLAPDTGIIDYLKVWKEVSYNYPNLEFLICGDGVLKEEIQKYIKKEAIPRVVLKGFVEDVPAYIKSAKIVFTSGYLGILEAFSYKKNVIATYDNALKKDYLTMIPHYDEMMWVSDTSVENMQKVFSSAMNNTSKREKAYQYALQNSWNKVKEDYYTLWKH